MKPNFALLLSLDGIALLHRAAGGWRRVGSVRPDAPDLSRQLSAMREKALMLEPDGLRSKVVVPNDQIRYMTVQTGAVGGDARTEAVRAALTGATPYALDELAYDISIDGDQTHVAAVAHQTLAEAEGFAVEHRFEPICFVAAPGDEAFLGEPYFGAAKHAATLGGGDSVEADGIAVVVVGDVALPTESSAGKPRSDAAPASVRATAAPDASDPADREPAPETAGTPADDDDDADSSDQDAPVTGFASRRARQAAATAPRNLGGADRTAPLPPAARRLTLVADDTDAAEPQPPAAEPVVMPVNAPSLVAPKAAPPAKEPKRGFFSRRAPDAAKPEPKPKPRAVAIAKPPATSPRIDDLPPGDETARMTLFGARTSDADRNKPRHLGLILTAALLLFLAAIAAWASLFLDDGVAGLWRWSESETEIAALPDTAPAPATPPQIDLPAPRAVPLAAVPPDPDIATPADPAPAPARENPQPPTLSDTDSAVLDALGDPADPADPATDPDPASDLAGTETDDLEDQAFYAATGIWQTPPDVPETPSIIGLDDLYVASIDRTDLSQDAVALPSTRDLTTDDPPVSVTSPAAADTVFDLDADGLVTATPEGTVTPEGVTVYLGRPSVVPPPTPDRQSDEPEADVARERLAAFRPRPRPGDLIERNERAQLGGLSRAELSGVRPRLRPENVKTDAEENETPTAQAVGSSIQPKVRPVTLAAAAAAAAAATRQTKPAEAEPEAEADDEPETPVAAAAPATVTPRIPSSTSVSRQATLNNAINLRKVNLIGVYGTPSNRRALVRLPSGRYKKVKVGDSVDGGRVVAIGDSELRYQKSGRNVTLKMPRG